MDYIIRFATKNDLTLLSKLFDAYRVYYKQPSDAEKATSFMFDRLEKQDSTVLVAESRGKLLGFTQLYPIFSSVSAKKSLLLNDLYVASDARRQGVARALLQKAREYAKQEGCCWVMLQTERSNENAQSLYESLGYQRDNESFYYYLSMD